MTNFKWNLELLYFWFADNNLYEIYVMPFQKYFKFHELYVK